MVYVGAIYFYVYVIINISSAILVMLSLDL